MDDYSEMPEARFLFEFVFRLPKEKNTIRKFFPDSTNFGIVCEGCYKELAILHKEPAIDSIWLARGANISDYYLVCRCGNQQDLREYYNGKTLVSENEARLEKLVWEATKKKRV